MSLSSTTPRGFDPAHPELVDLESTPDDAVRDEMLMLAKANRWLGGHQLILGYVRRLAPPGPLTILDLGTGTADVPRVLVEWARRENRPVSVTAVDINPRVLELARTTCAGYPEITLERHDLRALPYAARSFDLVLCSQALHHFTSEDAVVILRSMGSIASSSYMVNDLRRSRTAIWLTHLFSLMLISSKTLRQDARHSARAAFTVDELRGMADRAGLSGFEIKCHHGVFKMVLAGRI